MSKRLLLIFSAITLAIIIVLSLYFVLSQNRPKQPHSSISLTSNLSPTPDPNRSFSVLLLGYGGANHQGALLTDSIILAHVNPGHQVITLISIPRDLWVNIPLTSDLNFPGKINSLYAIGSDDYKYPDKTPDYTGPHGGGRLAKKVISEVVGFPIDYYISIDFQGFIKAIDNLGGIEVNVPRTFDDNLYPIEGKEADTCGLSSDQIMALEATVSGAKLEQSFPCRYEQLHFDQGLVHMDGATALKYVRSRHSPTDGGDFNRSERQRSLIESVKLKVLSLNYLSHIPSLISTLSQSLSTDLDILNIHTYLSQASEFANYKISSLALTHENVLVESKSSDHQYILIPQAGLFNWQDIHRFITSPTPSP